MPRLKVILDNGDWKEYGIFELLTAVSRITIASLVYQMSHHMKYILKSWILLSIFLIISLVLTACDPAPKRFLVVSSGSFKSSDGVTEGFRSASVDSYPSHEACMEALKKRKSGECVDQQYLDSMQDNLQLIPNFGQ